MNSQQQQDAESHSARVPIIGIVGGIGSGKSAVGRWVAEAANLHFIDADKLGHEALQRDDVRNALRSQFGEGIFDPNGTVLRAELAKLVFGACEIHQAARHELEKIVHPVIERRIRDEVDSAQKLGRDAVLLDAAVLLEAGWKRLCDVVVFIDAADSIRAERVRRRNGWTIEELHRREASQLSSTEKRQQCDTVITNNDSLAESGEQLLNFLREAGIISCKPSSESSQQLSSK